MTHHNTNTPANDKETILEELLLLRSHVAMHCEKENWWDSTFMNDTSTDILDYIFPRSKFSAALNSAFEVAKGVHDKFVGKGKYHLFRLSEPIEEKLFFELSKNGVAEEIFRTVTGNKSNFLEEMSASIAVSTQEGPVLIGNISEINDKSLLASFAKHYLEALDNNYQTFPYLQS